MFGKILAELRKQKKLSQYDLAEQMKLSRGQIANYEQGKRQPDFETLLQFAYFFGVSTDYLLTGKASGQLTILPNEYGVHEVPENTRFPIRLKKTMEEKNMSVERLAKILDVDENTIDFYLKVPTMISFAEDEMKLLEKIALILDTPLDKLLGRKDDVLTNNSKDERDIAKRMEQLRHDLQNAEGLAFDGEPMSEEARGSLLEAMEFGVRLAKRNNKKFIPKKYRENDEE